MPLTAPQTIPFGETLTSGEKTLVIGMSDPKETQAIYDAMLEKVDK